jgi:cytochrome oxidase Cu insertion factor (SCO1/SenC/PrrC family)
MNVPAKQLKKQRIELILLFALPILGIVLMTAYYFYVIENNTQMGTHNKGTLVSPPKPTSELNLSSAQQPFKLNDGSGKWSFLIVGKTTCASDCQQQLYLTRQIKEAMGKYKLRIRNVYLMNAAENEIASEQLRELLRKEYSGHTLAEVDAQQFALWSASQQPDLEALPDNLQFFVIDPAGWLMMYYTSEQNYKQVISDMKFLIKNS